MSTTIKSFITGLAAGTALCLASASILIFLLLTNGHI